MSILRNLFSRFMGLPPAESTDIVTERDLAVPMPDGVILRADRYYARGNERAPVILIRTPYGRSFPWPLFLAVPYAQRGFQVVFQSCRGTFGSGGKFDPFRHERGDGLATVAWLREQAWFPGQLGTLGMSYVGFVQWAIQAEVPELKAMSVQVSSSDFRASIYSGGSFWLETALFWALLVSVQERGLLATLGVQLRGVRAVRRAANVIPLRDAGRAVTGQDVPFLTDWLEHDAPGDPFWAPVDFSGRVGEGEARVHLVAGFYDVFLPQTLADYARLRAAGKDPHLTLGPWHHTDQPMMRISLRESLAWFRAHLLGDRSALRASPVRVFVAGEGAWRDLPEWPPPHRSERWHLQPDRGLSLAAPRASDPDRYRYDPADPTPTVGGSTLLPIAGAKDNRAVEARRDVLCYSTPVLDRDVVAIGPVEADLHVASSLEHTDFFVRICDVDPKGTSINVTDGLVRLSPGRGSSPAAGGAVRVTIPLWPMAHCFRRGHRIRVQVSSGAHPRYVRNPGSGEPLATATRLVAADQTVFHDPDRPSAIVLPIVA